MVSLEIAKKELKEEGSEKWFIAEYERELGFDDHVIFALILKAKDKKEAEAIFNRWALLMQGLEEESSSLVRISEIKTLDDLTNFPSIFLSKKDLDELEKGI